MSLFKFDKCGGTGSLLANKAIGNGGQLVLQLLAGTSVREALHAASECVSGKSSALLPGSQDSPGVLIFLNDEMIRRDGEYRQLEDGDELILLPAVSGGQGQTTIAQEARKATGLDPSTVEKVVQFHGHMCPGLAMGIHAAEIALREIGPHSPHEEVGTVRTAAGSGRSRRAERRASASR